MLYRFDITLDGAALPTARLERHASETIERLTLRVVARMLLPQVLLTDSTGLCRGEEPALSTAPDEVGRREVWVEVGTPPAAKLERALSRADRVVLVTDEARTRLQHAYGSRKRLQSLELRVLQSSALETLAAWVERSNRMSSSKFHLCKRF